MNKCEYVDPKVDLSLPLALEVGANRISQPTAFPNPCDLHWRKPESGDLQSASGEEERYFALTWRMRSPCLRYSRRWRSNPSGKCSQDQPARGAVTSTMRRAVLPSGGARCGAGADCSAMKYQSLRLRYLLSASGSGGSGVGVLPNVCCSLLPAAWL